jgi:methionyl-tRNA formyltransferase
MRIVLFADGFVGNEIASFLIDNYPEDLSLVVCLTKNSIFRYAKEKDIPVCHYDEEKKILNELNCDLGVLAWWPKIIKEPLLSLPNLGFINTHPSLLPYNRGKHYNFWALVEEAPFGVTLHFIDSGIDTGDIIFQMPIDYDWCDTGETLYKKAQAEMVRLFVDNYHLIRVGNYKRSSQDIKSGSYHHSSELNKICEIKLKEKYQARKILNLLRARTFKGHPGCFFEEKGIKYEIYLTIKKKVN